MAIPILTADAVRRSLEEYDRLGRDAFLTTYGHTPAREYFIVDRDRRYDSKAIAGVAHGYADSSGVPLTNKQFSGGEKALAKKLEALGFRVIYEPRGVHGASRSIAVGRPALPLPLHGRTSRKEAYALFDIDFDQRQQQLTRGLSPRLPDGGYFICITLDKTDMDEAYDYEDELQPDSLQWITRRGVTEDDDDYVALRNLSTRVSLLARHHKRDLFAYLGEMRYVAPHEQFNAPDGRTQMRFLFRLEHAVPEDLYQGLHGGAAPGAATQARKRPMTQSTAPTVPRSRRPTTFGQARQALSYTLGHAQRVMVPAHQHYQVRLEQFLTRKRITSEGERNFVDLTFMFGAEQFIGEIKVTSHLTLDEAFRSALGQVLFYGHMLFDPPPNPIMLLDRVPDARRIALATKLGVSVVVERVEGEFELLNPTVSPALASVFPSAAIAYA